MSAAGGAGLPSLPPPRPIPLKERSSIIFIEKGRLDVLDGAFAWGTCGPEIGGMTGREVVKALEILSAARLVAMDCVEVAPFLDPSGNTARVGARVVLDVLAGRIAARGPR